MENNTIIKKTHKNSFFVKIGLGSFYEDNLFSSPAIYKEQKVIVLQVASLPIVKNHLIVELVDENKYVL